MVFDARTARRVFEFMPRQTEIRALSILDRRTVLAVLADGSWNRWQLEDEPRQPLPTDHTPQKAEADAATLDLEE
jgi:hypothetical protein